MRTSRLSFTSLALLPVVGGIVLGLTGAEGCASDDSPAVVEQPGIDGSATGCPTGQLTCSGTCTATASDENNCGACGTKCAAGEVCSAGACGVTCGDGGTTQCGTDCVDTAVDPANCGGCGNTCATGYACNEGTCGFICPTSFTKCSPASGDAGAGDGGASSAPYCANLTNDALNCGACGKTCLVDLGETCVNNACVQACEAVLLVGTHATASAELQSSLMATGSFCPVDFFDYSTVAPTPAELAPYKAVLVYTTLNTSDAIDTAIGDSLATYYDAGGRVVISLFANGGYKLTGKFGTVANGYMLFDPAPAHKTADSLGTLAEPLSPLLRNVSALTGTVYHGAPAVVNGGVIVASWTNGSPLVVRGVVKGRKRADLNFLPLQVSGGTPNTQQWTGDGISLVRNALLYR